MNHDETSPVKGVVVCGLRNTDQFNDDRALDPKLVQLALKYQIHAAQQLVRYVTDPSAGTVVVIDPTVGPGAEVSITYPAAGGDQAKTEPCSVSHPKTNWKQDKFSSLQQSRNSKRK